MTLESLGDDVERPSVEDLATHLVRIIFREESLNPTKEFTEAVLKALVDSHFVENMAAEAYQAAAMLAYESGNREHPAVLKLLDNLSSFPWLHKDLLPFPGDRRLFTVFTPGEICLGGTISKSGSEVTIQCASPEDAEALLNWLDAAAREADDSVNTPECESTSSADPGSQSPSQT